MPIKSSKFKLLQFALCIMTLQFVLCTLHLPPALAATMTNDNYTVQKRGIQIQPFVTPTITPRQITQKPLTSGENFIVETSNPESFSFSISHNSLNFGKLQPTNPVIRDLNLTISSSQGYQILTAQDHPLRTLTSVTIPDTTCDNGSCSEFTAAPWLNTLTYGFGYHVAGIGDDYYKQFADGSRNESFQAIAEGKKAQDLEAKVTYRVNTSGTQTIGSYLNTVSYIATPDF